MRLMLYPALMTLLLVPDATSLWAQTAGETKLGVTTIELQEVIKGLSARRHVLNHDVYNDKGEKIGRVEDLILTRDRAVSYAIVSTGGFLGIGSHDVAIPAAQLKMTDDRLVLPNATKELIRAMPPFEYGRK
jgi:sporulation protein YlmC with PRC-barrel domain